MLHRAGMSKPDDAIHDPARLAAVRDAELLDTEAEEVFDQLTRLAARLVAAPIAMVSVLDDRRHFSKSEVGLTAALPPDRNLPLSVSVCRRVVGSGAPLVVPDAREDPQLRDDPAVRAHGVVAYLGVPLIDPEGHALGTLCVLDGRPRAWNAQEIETLRSLAGTVMSTITLRAEARRAARAASAPEGSPGAPPASQVAELRRLVAAHVEALDHYDDVVRSATKTPEHLERERAGQRLVAETLAALEAAVPPTRAGAPPTDLATDATTGVARLVAAVREYVRAERAREVASAEFVEQRLSLDEFQIACAAVQPPEHAMRRALLDA